MTSSASGGGGLKVGTAALNAPPHSGLGMWVNPVFLSPLQWQVG